MGMELDLRDGAAWAGEAATRELDALIDERERLRTALMFIATAYYSAPEVLREAAREAYESVPNATGEARPK